MPALGLVFSQQEYSSAAQAAHAPQAIGNGTTTRSPTRSLSAGTPDPTSITPPKNQLPRVEPSFMVGHDPSDQGQIRTADRGGGDPYDGVAVVEDSRVRHLANLDLVPAGPGVGPHASD